MPNENDKISKMNVYFPENIKNIYIKPTASYNFCIFCIINFKIFAYEYEYY